MLAIAAALALAATATVNLDKVLAKPTTKVRSQTKLSILLPKSMPLADASTKLYGSGSGSRDGYTFRLTTTRTCEANYCFAASFRAERGTQKLPGGTRIQLAKGRKGTYWKLSCGASCAPAVLTWTERGATYTIEAMVTERAGMKAMADAAIKRGPR
ncbi:MAG TPA: hypothetical protein VNS09_05065 [Solirubrobacter sp.]|nr:hypothetical protein [Solirubrobacter sp.]